MMHFAFVATINDQIDSSPSVCNNATAKTVESSFPETSISSLQLAICDINC